MHLFGLESRDVFHQNEMKLSLPGPAPDVNTLWLTFTRPECYFFHLAEDLFEVFGCEPNTRIITGGDFEEEKKSFIVKDEYRRIHLFAMLDHMAMWYMLGNEEEVASWLLWKRKSMMKLGKKVEAVEGHNCIGQIALDWQKAGVTNQ